MTVTEMGEGKSMHKNTCQAFGYIMSVNGPLTSHMPSSETIGRIVHSIRGGGDDGNGVNISEK